MKSNVLAICLLAAASLVSCSKKTDTATTDSTGMVNTAPMDTVRHDTTGMTAPNPTGMSDAQILGEMHMGDSTEVAEAKLVSSKSKNADVKGFAKMMIEDHGKMLADDNALAKKLNIAPAMPDNSEAQSMMQQLSSATATSIDSMYISMSVEDHQKDLSKLQDAQAKAQNAELKDAIGKALPVIQKHLDRAKAIWTKMQSTAKK